jgi:hypothetical protein
MKDIYTVAHQTAAYLGESNEEIVGAFKALQVNQAEGLLLSRSPALSPHLHPSPISVAGNTVEIPRL